MVCSFVFLVLYLFPVLLVFSCFIQATVIVLYLFHSLVIVSVKFILLEGLTISCVLPLVPL